MGRRRARGIATGAKFDRDTREVVVSMSDGSKFSFAVAETDGLMNAELEDLERIEISPTGLGLHWPSLDEDLYVPTLVQDSKGLVQNSKRQARNAQGGDLRNSRNGLSVVPNRKRVDGSGNMHFELYKGKDGHWRWRLKVQNGNIIADSSQGYSRREDCEHGIELVKKSASASTVDTTKAA